MLRRGTATSGRGGGLGRYGPAFGAGTPGLGGVARRAPVRAHSAGRIELWPALPALAVAAVLGLAWLIVAPRTPDLAAAVYRTDLFRSAGLAIWDTRWYGGHPLPAYSLIFPPLAGWIGVRLLGLLCVLAATVLFGLLASERWPTGAVWGSMAFAVAAAGDLWIGRIAFALGVPFALAGCLALVSGRRGAAVVLSVVCAAASPAAALLLGLAALSESLADRSLRSLACLALPAAMVVLLLSLLFPEGGFEPFPLVSFLATAAVTGAFLVALPAGEGLLRGGGVLYLLACLLCLLVHSPVGSNIERYGVLLGAPLLICALLERPARLRRTGPGLGFVGLLAVAGIAVWVLWGPVRETRAGLESPATSASYYRPLESFLAGRQAAGPVRVEVPLTRSHWEAALLAPEVALARGWDKQLDERYAGVLLGHHLTAVSYRAWLLEQGVTYVALPDAPLDGTAGAEGRLIRSGLPYLKGVFSSRHWRVFEVVGARGLASGPGRLVALGRDSFSLRADRAGRFLVREHFTRFWTLARGRGCVAPGAGGWTEVTAAQPGFLEVAARFSVGRVFDGSGSCSGGASSGSRP